MSMHLRRVCSNLSTLGGLALGALLVACGGAESAPPATPAAVAPAAVDSAAVTPPQTAAVAPVTQAVQPEAPATTVTQTTTVAVFSLRDVGFATPESVLYDPADDVYIVSNINGAPGHADNNGFLSKVSPDGKVLELKWVEGGKKGAKLHAPKGMAIVDDTLFVTDIDTVRKFDRKTGKAKGEVKIPGSTFLNDIAAYNGKVFVSDSGVKFSDKGIENTKSDALWVIEKGKAKKVAGGDELGHPNGLLATADGLWVVSINGDLYQVDDKGVKAKVQGLGKGMLDGIMPLNDGVVIISSWQESGIFRGKPGEAFAPVVSGLKQPADIGYDAKRGRVLVPLFSEHVVEVYDVK